MPSGRLALLSLLVLVLAGAGVVLATKGGHSAASPARATAPNEHEIHTPSFATPIPSGWYFVQERKSIKGARGFHLSSTGAAVNGLGIAPKGTAAITVSESAPGILAAGKIDGRPLSAISPSALMPRVIGQPAEAVSVVTAEAPQASTLAGAAAARAAFGYGFHGRGMMQIDVIAEHGGRLFSVELDAEPSQASVGQAALATMLSAWHWR
jgi:hypothetical protein